MFWPLIGAFIAFVLVAVLLGWIMDQGPQDGGAGPDQHH
jgi:F0F1-type ATP synthase assembly protein I